MIKSTQGYNECVDELTANCDKIVNAESISDATYYMYDCIDNIREIFEYTLAVKFGEK